MALTKITLTGAADNLNTAFTKVNDIIDDLLSTSSGLGASQIGIEDSAGNLSATNVEAGIAEIYSTFGPVKDIAEILEEDSDTTTGLTWGFKAGTVRLDNSISTVSAGTIGLTDDAINYIEVDPSDATVKKNTSAFTSGRIPIRTVITSAGSQTTSTDSRAWFTQSALATTAAAGTIRIASSAEVLTGTEAGAAVTPDTLQDKITSILGTSSGQAPTNADLGSAAYIDVGTSVGNVVQLVDVGGSAGLPAVKGDNLTGVILKALLTSAGDIIYATAASTPARLAKGTDGQILKLASGLPSWAAETPGFFDAYVKVSDTKSSGTNGGTATSGSWETRTINTEDFDRQSIASIASNRITLPAGTYICHCMGVASECGAHQIRLFNYTNSVALLLGLSADSSSTAINTISHAVGEFTLSGTVELEIQHMVATTKATTGYGRANSWGDNVFMTAEFWRKTA